MWENLSKYQVVLGSQSPRRVELLSGLDIAFEQIAMPDIDESYPADLPAPEVPEYIAQRKADAYADQLKPNTLLITADTVVIVDGQILGKPKDEDDAYRMLELLSGRRHQVVTGVVVMTQEKRIAFSSTTEVVFGKLSYHDMRYYIERYRPMDKAGAYGIQEWVGYCAIEHVEGSFYNVMGLPVHQLTQVLRDF